MGNGYCNNCNSWESSWAEHQSHNPTETYRRDIRCGKCDRHSLTYTDSQKSRYKELVKERTWIPGTVYKVERFSTWGNNNLATVVSYYDGYYHVFLLVYVKENDVVKVFPESSSCSYGGDYSEGRFNQGRSSSAAQIEADCIQNELTIEGGKYYGNPILLIHPYCDCSRSFDTFVSSPYVGKEEIGRGSSAHCGLFYISSGGTPSNLDEYFKPLDIIKIEKRDIVFGKSYYHVGVYLGKDAICHVSDPNGLISEENIKARITSGDTFLKGWLGTPINGRTGELYRYRSIVPFKYYKKSIEQAVKAGYKDFGSGKYDLYNDNCEHFANAIVYGIYFSEQIDSYGGLETFMGKVGESAGNKQHNVFGKIFQPNHGGTVWRDIPLVNLVTGRSLKTNNKYPGQSRDFCLRDEINSWNSNGRFENLTSYEPSKIEEYEKQYSIQVPPKENCRIM